MGRRVTIVLDDDLIKKLRLIQAKIIFKNPKVENNSSSYSFSRVVNDMLRKTLK